MNWINVITAFMASKPGTTAEQKALLEIAEGLAARNIGEVVYGGGDAGLMHDFASYCKQAGVAQVTGYIPQFMLDWRKQDPATYASAADVEHAVESMDMRKLRLIERCDVGLTFPGATGTMEEFWQFLVTEEFKSVDPEARVSDMVVLNLDGYYDHIRAHIDHIVSAGKHYGGKFNMLHFVDDAPSLLDKLDQIDRRGPLYGRDLD